MNKEELHEFIEKQQPNICQIVAYKNNEKVYSDCWNDYKADDCTHIMSATKSIVALLIGIALDKGQIRSIDDKVLDYFPDYKVKRGEKTIYDVKGRQGYHSKLLQYGFYAFYPLHLLVLGLIKLL